MAFWKPTQSEANPHSFKLQAGLEACVGPPDRQYIMGGVAVATAIDAMEQVTKKPILWASCHFLATPELGTCLDIDVETPAIGRNIIQAFVSIKENERSFQRLSGSLGGRSGFIDHQFTSMPNVCAPSAASLKDNNTFVTTGNLLDRFERRTALVDEANGVEYMWVRAIDDLPMDAGLLAIMADFMLGAHPLSIGGPSLDNVIRFHTIVPTNWVLCATAFSGFVRGSVHGSLQLFSESGILMADANQTGVLPRNK